MRTKTILATLLSATALLDATPEPVEPDPKLVHIVILDDLTDPNLEHRHGIRRVAPEDLQILFDGVALLGLRVQMDHFIIDEDASDAKPTSLRVEALDAKLPEAPNLRIYRTSEETQRMMATYDSKRKEFRAKLATHLKQTEADSKSFSLRLQEQQLEAEHRADSQLLANGGKDWARSAVANHLLTAGKLLNESAAATRILICNSDLVDQVRGRPSRKTALTAEELPAEILIGFPNQSGQPDRSPLVATTPNPKLHAPNMTELMKQILNQLPKPEK